MFTGNNEFWCSQARQHINELQQEAQRERLANSVKSGQNSKESGQNLARQYRQRLQQEILQKVKLGEMSIEEGLMRLESF